ncbi:MAG: Holliday junction branch migration protein RuvA [Rhodospirillaceae bacterium]|nr:Holliday junction branch migration protein RuvA [Rhodospirillaceae bacterium]|tara:strand:- start:652 stop:1254 length:603 start_codon:yes stop_codon:yes gene_type:complete
MIASLTGVLETVAEDFAVVDVSGVGYLVFCSGRTLANLPQPGEPVRFVVETHVREDHINLYGFAEAGERDWFRLLTSVQGVGAKVALAILSAIGSEELIQAVAAQDKTVVSRANGVGPKLAGRIVLELKDKVGGLVPSGLSASVRGAPSSGDESEDAISALVNLGFQRTDAFGAVVRAAEKIGEKAGVDDLIRVGLQELS